MLLAGQEAGVWRGLPLGVKLHQVKWIIVHCCEQNVQEVACPLSPAQAVRAEVSISCNKPLC